MKGSLLLLFLFDTAHSLSNNGPTIGSTPAKAIDMTDFSQRLSRLEAKAPAFLGSFYDPSVSSFSVMPGRNDALSITSTCFALQACTTNPQLYGQDLICMDPQQKHHHTTSISSSSAAEPPATQGGDDVDVDRRVPVRTILQALVFSEWRTEDMFQVPLLLHTLLQVDPNGAYLNDNHSNSRSVEERLSVLINAVLEARPRRRDGTNQKYSDYIQYQCTKVYATLYEKMSQAGSHRLDDRTRRTVVAAAGLPDAAVGDSVALRVSTALSRCAEVSFNELCRQLALRSSGDSSSFDVMRLAYSLLTYVTATKALAGGLARQQLGVVEGGAGRVTMGLEEEATPRLRPVNRRIVQAALAAFMEEQEKDGLWVKGQPIYRSFRRTGRNIGNAFIFAVDTVASLMELLPAQDFRPHLLELRNTLDWIESHETVEYVSDPRGGDSESGYQKGKAIHGWTSQHLSSDDVGPQAWSTAQTLSCVSRMKTTLETIMHQDVLEEFGGARLSENGVVTAAWERLLDSDLGECGLDQDCTLKAVLKERMIAPRVDGDNDSNVSVVLGYSAILFGPPGTAKTTICEALAQNLGWDFLVIDTSVFLADGLSNVASRIQYVFKRLQSLRDCVILFDEIEEFCLDRETPGVVMESRMLTTAMLTAINDLRRGKKSVFFLATNRLRAFDAAIIRPGRFDMQLFVGTPNRPARLVQFRQKLANGPGIDAETRQEATERFDRFLMNNWDEARFLNYLEGLQFAGACANLVAQGLNLTEERMAPLLKSQTSVMTVRGSVREEFLASMELTRL